jgi:uncharacterized membrane protein YgcG
MRLGAGQLRPQVVQQVVYQVVQRLITGLEERITTAEWPSDRARLLEALYVLAQARNAAQVRINTLVHSARRAGASWSDIGKALGMTRQAAHGRYRPRRRRNERRSGGQTSGGQTSGGQTSGGQTSGGETSGGESPR